MELFKPVPALAEALAKAQGSIKPPVKKCNVDFVNNKGQRVKYSYADLADVIEAIREPLSANGLSIVHQLALNENGYGLTTTLLHSTGEFISTWYPLPDPTQLKPQEFGSSLTYARRYSVSIVTGVASEEDDDASEALAPKSNAIKPRAAGEAVKPPNKAPIGKVFDALKPKFDEPPPEQFDSMPNYDEPAPEFTLLDQLFALAQEKRIPNPEVSKLIARVTGRQAFAKDLTHDELSRVVAFVKTYVTPKKPVEA